MTDSLSDGGAYRVLFKLSSGVKRDIKSNWSEKPPAAQWPLFITLNIYNVLICLHQLSSALAKSYTPSSEQVIQYTLCYYAVIKETFQW